MYVMQLKLIITSIKTLVTSVLLLLFTALLLTTTESGSRWLLPRALALGAWPIQLQYHSGTLWTGLRLQQVQLTYPRWALQIDQVSAEWQLDWPQITISNLQAQQVHLQLLPMDSATPRNPSQWQIPQLPLGVHLQQAKIEKFILQQAEQVYPPIALQLTADWQQALSGELQLQTQEFDPSIWNAKLSGKLDADLRLQFRSQRNRENHNEVGWQLRLLPSEIRGIWQQSPVMANFSADWQPQQSSHLDVKILLADNQLQFNGSIAAVEDVKDAQAWLNAPLQLTWQLHAEHLNQVLPELQGQLHANGQLSGSIRDPVLQAQLQSELLRYGQWDLQKLHSDLQLQARLPWPLMRDDWQIKILPSELTAQWRGQPLKMNVEALIDAQQASQLLLKSTLANNQLSVVLQQPFVLSWQLKAPELTHLWPDWQGQVFSQGNISGSLRDPLINAELEAKQLRYQQQTLSALKVSVQGKLSQHDLQISADDQRVQAQLKAQGGVNVDAASGRYRVLTSSMDVPNLGRWQQQQPSVWSQQAGVLSLERSCWQQQTSRLCAALKGPLSALLVDAQLFAVPLAVLQASALQSFLPKGLSAERLAVEGQVSADLHGQLQNKNWLGKVNVQVSAGAFLYPLPEKNSPEKNNTGKNNTGKNTKRYSWRSARFQLQQDAQQLQANGSWDYQQYGQISGQWRRQANGELAGQLQANFQQLPLLEPYLIGVQNLKGQVQLNMQVAGRLPTPTYTGNIHWQNGSLRLPAQNLQISAIDARGELIPDHQLKLAGIAFSDRGQVQLSGQLALPTTVSQNFYQMLSGQLRLQGQDFQVSNTRRNKIWASPDLTLLLAPQKLILTGLIQVPQANVRLKELPYAVVQVSKDVVFMQDGQPQVRQQPGWQQYLSTDVKIVLGEACNFQGLGLQADLSGQVQWVSIPGKPAQAYGEIIIPKGSYQKYGQDLTIQQGILRFQGAPDNPALNIQALRHTDSADVTLALGGTLKMPSSKVYSSPPLPDSEAMALLVTGKPLSSSSKEDNNKVADAAFSLGVNRSQSMVNRVAKTVGVDTLKVETGSGLNNSALLIGKYLNPSLYLTYVRGLFAQTSSVGMEYKLTPKATIKAQSGNESSLDVLYRFERD